MEISRWRQRAGRYGLGLEAAIALTAASLRIGLTRRGRLVQALGVADHVIVTAPPTPIEELAPDERARILSSRRVGRVVERVAGLLPWQPTCLRQSLATVWMLRRRGIPPVLHLGVADVPSMDAHAWVTVDGRTVNGRTGRHFTTVASFHG